MNARRAKVDYDLAGQAGMLLLGVGLLCGALILFVCDCAACLWQAVKPRADE